MFLISFVKSTIFSTILVTIFFEKSNLKGDTVLWKKDVYNYEREYIEINVY